MKKAIEKPFKVNHKIYVIMTVVSCMGIICGCYWINLNQCSNNIIDIIKNISLGCLASTIVAWLLEICNVREKNQKIGQVYEMVYAELKYRILSYIQIWGEFYVTSSKCDEKEKHTWLEW